MSDTDCMPSHGCLWTLPGFHGPSSRETALCAFWACVAYYVFAWKWWYHVFVKCVTVWYNDSWRDEGSLKLDPLCSEGVDNKPTQFSALNGFFRGTKYLFSKVYVWKTSVWSIRLNELLTICLWIRCPIYFITFKPKLLTGRRIRRWTRCSQFTYWPFLEVTFSGRKSWKTRSPIAKWDAHSSFFLFVLQFTS